MARAKAGRRLRVLYVAVQDTSYPRNSRLRQYFVDKFDADVRVLELNGPPGYVRHCLHLLREGLRLRGPFDVVVLAELSVPFAWLSWVLARRFRAVHIVDFFIGLVETQIGDRGAVAQGSPRARVLGLFDQIALTSATIVLSDTQVRADRISPRLRESRRAISLPVGAPAWARPSDASAPPTDTTAPLKILYYGNYVPLHGVATFIEALALLDDTSRFSVTMLGDGEQRTRAEERTVELGLQAAVSFVDPVPESQLGALIDAHHIIIGIFGQSAKASSVIANKVWQGLAAGKAVITRESPALAEISDLVGSHLIQVAGGDAAAIALALNEVAGSTDLRALNLDAHIQLEQYVNDRYASFGTDLRTVLPAVARTFRSQGDAHA